ncbi:hypothetical protein GCM10009819_35220 [Agromyces tropicus]|uniref:Secreted protein n=1 Tax=Agromyces tropicus TaxID=555371 RepID=A0ABN2UXI7_9MICO
MVVVLPASMCAMMPMLRTLLRSVSTSSATGFLRMVGKVRGGGERMPRGVRERVARGIRSARYQR